MQPEATAPDDDARLSNRALFSYALPAAPVQFLFMLFLFMYLKYATDSLGASPAIVGTIFLVARVWDAVSDPLVGNLSDRTKSRLGRRRPWLLGSALPLFGFGLMAWVPPESLSGAALNAWIAVAIVGFYTAYTGFDVPHMALGAEITLDRQSRNRVFGARQFSRATAMLLSAGAVQILVDDSGGRDAAFWLAACAGVVTLLGIGYAVLSLPPEREEFMGRGGENPFVAMRDVLQNRHARLLLFVYFIESLGTGAIGMLIPFLLDDVMEVPELTGAMLGLTFLLAIFSIPAWVWLAGHYEKRHLWLGSMAANSVGFGLMLFMAKGTWPLMVVASVIVGLCNSCGNVLGYSIKAEVVDYDEYETGERKEGSYFAAWSFMNKLAAGIMVFVVGVVLELVGYVPDGPQNEAVKTWILILAGAMPLAGYLIGALAFTRFRLTEAEHARIRTALDVQAIAKAAASDP
jgi:sugar (glycoside-pentoside-hexuronide) transporter